MAFYLRHYITASCFITTLLILFYNTVLFQIFAGGDKGSGRGRTALYSWFYATTGIAVEFDNVVYVSDSTTGSIKLITPLEGAAEFLDALHSLTKRFSLQEKHASYSLKAIDKAIKLVEQCVSVIQNNDIISDLTKT